MENKLHERLEKIAYEKYPQIIKMYPKYKVLFIEALEAAYLMDRDWVSVKDRLPQESDIVLVFGTGIRASMAIYENCMFLRFIDLIKSDRAATIFYDNITHWMPLPKPPLT